MSLDIDFKYRVNTVNYRRSARRHKRSPSALLRGALVLGGISIIGVVLASNKSSELQPAHSAAIDLRNVIEQPITLPVTESEPGLSPPLNAQPAQTDGKLAKAAGPNWTEVTVQAGDSTSEIFSKLNIYSHLAPMMANELVKKSISEIKPGETFRVRIKDDQLVELIYSPAKTYELHIKPKGDTDYSIDEIEREVDTRTEVARGTISDSLYMDGKKQGLSDNVVMQLFNIFAYDIDFALDIREGDEFNVIYEEQFLNSEKLKDGAILAAEFTNKGVTYRAFRFTNDAGVSDYYAESGRSLKKAFIRTPVKFTRISSNFNPSRFHPILQKIKAHKGVDYAAPTGTPVRSTGNGEVVFKGVQGGYGNVVTIQHGKQYSTLYGHLSAFAKGLKQGQKVAQGEVIGFVGQTGRATGPHLHYEFRVNGVHKDPVTVKLPNGDPLNKKELARFKDETQTMISRLEAETPKLAQK